MKQVKHGLTNRKSGTMNPFNNSQPSTAAIIKHFKMKKHIEGGFSSLFYEDLGRIHKDSLPLDFDCERPYFNGIYFLVPQGVKTRLHQLPINEMWHFCLGDPLELYEIDASGQLKKTILGANIQEGHQLVHVVNRGNWFGSTSTGNYTLVTCTTSPGFRPQDYKDGKRSELINLFPHQKEFIIGFTS